MHQGERSTERDKEAVNSRGGGTGDLATILLTANRTGNPPPYKSLSRRAQPRNTKGDEGTELHETESLQPHDYPANQPNYLTTFNLNSLPAYLGSFQLSVLRSPNSYLPPTFPRYNRQIHRHLLMQEKAKLNSEATKLRKTNLATLMLL